MKNTNCIPDELNEIISIYPRYSGLFKDNLVVDRLIFIYKIIVSHIKEMRECSGRRPKPAICAVIKEIEIFHDRNSGKDGLNFKLNLTLKQFVGIIIKHVMEKNGYQKVKDMNISAKESQFFSSGSVYKKTAPDNNELKEKAAEFWYENNINEIIKKIWDLHLEKAQERANLLPHLAAISKNLFFSAHQAALMLESNYPGIIAASGLALTCKAEGSASSSYSFIDMVNDNIDNFNEESGREFSRVRICKWIYPQMSFSYNGFKYTSNISGPSFFIYCRKRPGEDIFSGDAKKNIMRELRKYYYDMGPENIENITTDRRLLSNILKNSKNSLTGSASPYFPFVTLQQAAFLMAEAKTIKELSMPEKMVELMMYETVFQNESNAELGFWPHEFSDGLFYFYRGKGYDHIRAAQSFIPILRLKS